MREPEVIDVHAHVLVPELESLVSGSPLRRRELADLRRTFGDDSLAHNAHLGASAWRRAMTELPSRIAAMDAAGVDQQLVSLSPAQYYAWAGARLATVLARTANAAIGTLVDTAPDRLRGLGTVAIQHAALAARQLEELMRDPRMVGVEIGTGAPGRDFSDSALDPFWAAAERTRAIVFVHPWGSSIGRRLDRYYLGNVVGNPAETTIALSHLVLSGVLDRYPELTVVAAHGGGYFPHYLSRADRAWHVRPESRVCAEPPSTYRSRIYYDTVVYEPRELNALLTAVGAERLVLGSDYPFDMADPHPVSTVLGSSAAPSGRRAILGGTVRDLLELQNSRRKGPQS